MRLVSLIVTMVVASVLTFYVLTCSVNNAPPTPVHPIVGKWQCTMIAGHPVSPLLISTSEYTADGKFINESYDPKHHFRRSTGTYIINDNRVLLTYDDRPDHQRHWSYSIDSITDGEFISLSGEPGQVANELGKAIRINK